MGKWRAMTEVWRLGGRSKTKGIKGIKTKIESKLRYLKKAAWQVWGNAANQ